MIRTFDIQDLPAVLDIWLASNIDAHDFIPKSYWEQQLPLIREMLPEAEIYIHENEGRIDAFIGLSGDHIEGLFVRREARSGGIGRELLDHVKKLHPVLSLNVYRKNERAIAFYKREGFVLQEEEVDEATGEAELIMVWPMVIPAEKAYYTYILLCSDGTLYTGWTTDLVKRLRAHNAGTGSKYTKTRLPVTPVYYESHENKQAAMRREYQMKQLSREEKMTLIRNFRK